MADLDNLEAWARRRGYDPDKDYSAPYAGYWEEVKDALAEKLADIAAGRQPEDESHFSPDEFRCHHCGELPAGGMDPDLLALLEQVRAHFGNKPVTINSGYRCPKHNSDIGGATNSQHLYGTAADIVVKDTKPSAVYAYLDPIHNGGLGSYDTFTHVDVRGSRARWSG